MDYDYVLWARNVNVAISHTPQCIAISHIGSKIWRKNIDFFSLGKRIEDQNYDENDELFPVNILGSLAH